MLRLAFDFIIAWREIRARPNAYAPFRENALYSFLNLLYIYLTPILSFHLINKIFIFHLQYYLSTFT
jgi:hypothetical protein